VPQKGKAATIPKSQLKTPTTRHLPEQFPEKGQSKNSGETSNLHIFDLPPFFLHPGNFLLSSPGLFFYIVTLALYLRSTVKYRLRTPYSQEASPWSYRGYRRIPHRSPGVQLPAATSTAATTVRPF
jgi:hypothetical protein